MSSLKVFALFGVFKTNVKNLQRTTFAYSHISKSKGTRKMELARKYKRPKDLENPYYKGIGPKQEVKRMYQSLLARGFTKEQASYSPPKDLEQELLLICQKVFGSQLSSNWKNQILNDPLMKYKVITKAVERFKKDVPNSLLHKMKDISDLYLFLNMPVDGCNHYDGLIRDSDKLPPNLHVMSESAVFNPETDTFFDGVTAFPGRKRIIHTKLGQKYEKTIEWPNV